MSKKELDDRDYNMTVEIHKKCPLVNEDTFILKRLKLERKFMCPKCGGEYFTIIDSDNNYLVLP